MDIKGLRKAVYTVNPYVPGKTIGEVQREYALDNIIKLGSNENPYGPFPNAIKAMERELKSLNTYPDTNFNEIKEVIGEKFGVDTSYIAVSHGSGGMLQTLAKTFIEDGDEVLIPLETYGLYKEISKLMGGVIKQIPLKSDYTLDLDGIRNAITDKTKLIWLCNPNNPTGTVFNLEAYNLLLDSLPAHTWVVLDEAYAEFANEEILPDAIGDIVREKNIIMVRTFSKAYGLAGARMGYAIARPEMIKAIDTVSEPFNASCVALAGAISTLNEDRENYEECLRNIKRDRERMILELEKMGFKVLDTHTNFVFFQTPYDGAKIAQELLMMGVIVRSCEAWEYPNAIRVTVGTREEVDEFLNSFRKVIHLQDDESRIS
ncbi:histidinol-phosphate aminotransferase [Sedimentibacter acidaminivorans]|uniref:Histidinol-phosphate aminotransferase n=1 Tax=Sedimentibacter acidaminivorans TaxID=913099 RepID=A0ABS4GCJ4_9FIRM|nr:histidinol-phosphate transaminase [Sedimentibacter acidaminivorans]MBP1925110.1 histidinol-phosphate aminotransferase [Sedimentibacter acidaminivorans]